MKRATVNGVAISGEAVAFELDRLVRFYTSHGMTAEEIKGALPQLQEKALDQAIGARLLLDRAQQLDIPVTVADVDAEVTKVVAQVGGEENYRKALAAQGLTDERFRKELEKGARVNRLVEQACVGVPDPTDAEVAEFYEAHKAQFASASQSLGDVHDQIKDLLRHQVRGRAMDAFVAELRTQARVEIVEGAANVH